MRAFAAQRPRRPEPPPRYPRFSSRPGPCSTRSTPPCWRTLLPGSGRPSSRWWGH